MNDLSTQNRLIELETRLAYQEHTLQRLSEALESHHQRLERLETAQRQFGRRLAQLLEAPETDSPIDEKPPHY